MRDWCEDWLYECGVDKNIERWMGERLNDGKIDWMDGWEWVGGWVVYGFL